MGCIIFGLLFGVFAYSGISTAYLYFFYFTDQQFKSVIKPLALVNLLVPLKQMLIIAFLVFTINKGDFLTIKLYAIRI